MKEVLNGFLFSLSYFSILPIFKKELEIKEETYKYTLFFFPLVGFILASLSIGANLFLNIYFHPIYCALVAAILYLFLYGFLHLEAVCDVADGWFASYSGKDVYKIMKEPTIGAIGAIYTLCFILLKVAIITYVLFEEQYALFIVVCILSRLNLMYLLQFFTFNKNSFLALAFAKDKALNLKIIALVYVIFCMFISSNIITLFIIALLSFYVLLKILNKKFGFVNGDCLGFTIEHTELILLNIGMMIIL